MWGIHLIIKSQILHVIIGQIDIESLISLKELPESTAISTLDQVQFSLVIITMCFLHILTILLHFPCAVYVVWR